MNFQAENSAD